MKRIEYDMYRSLAVWGRRVIKTENAVSRMKRVVKGRHWAYDSLWNFPPYITPKYIRGNQIEIHHSNQALISFY